MSLFKRFFNNKKEDKDAEAKHDPNSETDSNNESKVEVSGVATEEYFNRRYQEDAIDESMLKVTLEIIEGYFPPNKIKPIVEKPINHPKNLDQTIDDGFGFPLYCKAINPDEGFAVMVLAMAFNDFMIKNHNFKLYRDLEPEYPLRVMTLKYDHQGAKLSLYPIEYTSKVLRYEASFNDLYEKIKSNIEDMPSSHDASN